MRPDANNNSTGGHRNLQGRVKLRGENIKPLQFKVNFDSMSQRQRLQKALLFHLPSLGLAEEILEAAPFRSR